jgi:hypothetical protein
MLAKSIGTRKRESGFKRGEEFIIGVIYGNDS